MAILLVTSMALLACGWFWHEPSPRGWERKEPGRDPSLDLVRLESLRRVDAAIAQSCRLCEGAEGPERAGRIIDAFSGFMPSVDCSEFTPGSRLVRPDSNGDSQVRTTTKGQIRMAIENGWRLSHLEFFQYTVEDIAKTNSIGLRARFKAFATNALGGQRALLSGELLLAWSFTNSDRRLEQRLALIDAEVLSLACLRVPVGSPLFRLVFATDLSPVVQSAFVDPLIACYSASVGETSFLLPNAGRQVSRTGNGVWNLDEGTNWLVGVVTAAAAIDSETFLQADARGLWSSNLDGRRPPIPLWTAPAPLRHPEAIAMGDIDGDGDLDAWLVQYKAPYLGGQFPTPYFDANDGFSSYLLRNDGAAGYADITSPAGLGTKRRRRTYSASLIDLNGDGHLDLVNISDFAGVDVYRNDGHGHFEDVTAGLGDAHYTFGMGHSFGDWNGNGLPDLFVPGMDSPAASMLDALHFDRPGFAGYSAHRASMTAGNRAFLGSRAGLSPAAWSEQVAHSGWSWGSAIVDLANSGHDDIYVVNGHETLPNPEDFEWQFWTQDIYAGTSQNDSRIEKLFQAQAADRYRRGISYGGWQANALFTQVSTNRWEDVAWLYGLAETADCRNVVAEDFDNDGGMDLVMTTYELWPVRRQRLLVYHNEIAGRGNWIGFRFDWRSPARSLVGAKLVVDTEAGSRTHWFVTGDSYRSQPSFSAHFGLGKITGVLSAEVVWPDGKRKKLTEFEPNRWNIVAW